MSDEDDDGPVRDDSSTPSSDSESDSEPEFLTFEGNDGEDVTVFLRDLKRKTIAEGKQKDAEWLVDEMEASLSGPALVWYFSQDDDVRMDFNKLRIAMLKQFGGLSGGRSVSTQGPSQDPSTDASTYAADPDPEPTPTSAPEKEPTPPPRTPEPAPPNRRGRLWVLSWNGVDRANEGYISRKVSSKRLDAWVFERTSSRDKDNHLIVEILELPDKSIRLVLVNLDYPGGEKLPYLGLLTDWTKSANPFLGPCSEDGLGYRISNPGTVDTTVDGWRLDMVDGRSYEGFLFTWKAPRYKESRPFSPYVSNPIQFTDEKWSQHLRYASLIFEAIDE